MDETFSSALGIIKVVGPFILLAAIAYGVLNASRRTKAEKDRGDQATHDLYTNDRAQHDNIEGEQSGPDSAPRRPRDDTDEDPMARQRRKSSQER